MKIGLKISRRLFYFISISMQSCVAKIVQEHSIDTTTSYLICKSSVSTLVCLLPTLRKNKIYMYKEQCWIQTFREGGSSRPLHRRGPGLQKHFSALRVSVWSENKGKGRTPPLDPPLESAILNLCYRKAIHFTLHSSHHQLHHDEICLQLHG